MSPPWVCTLPGLPAIFGGLFHFEKNHVTFHQCIVIYYTEPTMLLVCLRFLTG